MKVVQAIPYKTLKDKIRKVKEAMNKGFRVEITPGYIYAEKYIQDEELK